MSLWAFLLAAFLLGAIGAVILIVAWCVMAFVLFCFAKVIASILRIE